MFEAMVRAKSLKICEQAEFFFRDKRNQVWLVSKDGKTDCPYNIFISRHYVHTLISGHENVTGDIIDNIYRLKPVKQNAEPSFKTSMSIEEMSDAFGSKGSKLTITDFVEIVSQFNIDKIEVFNVDTRTIVVPNVVSDETEERILLEVSENVNPQDFDAMLNELKKLDSPESIRLRSNQDDSRDPYSVGYCEEWLEFYSDGCIFSFTHYEVKGTVLVLIIDSESML